MMIITIVNMMDKLEMNTNTIPVIPPSTQIRLKNEKRRKRRRN